ncbi:unnamed protein product [Lepeophtheirus salmonis]|uniref:(salmon louse) hypothetical protein n=1 Tax=Lepeophtheirus salmonis TaxID=72036 RepID=A0A7R8H328_LEPSM|nr:unnamed protein product [Lepeophtheirus salmonis]CAF2823191.1 unnamed protein product [Lepeophtheirus salmonis]
MSCFKDAECQFYEKCGNLWEGPCPGGVCELAPWFISVFIWTIIGTLCGIVLCFRCKFCLFHKLYFKEDRRNLLPFMGHSSEYRSDPRMSSTFPDIVLARSLSQQADRYV